MQQFRISIKGLITKGDTILFLKRATNNRWELPGGTVEFGESVEETLCREIKEELGQDLVLESIKPVGSWVKVMDYNDRQEHRMVVMYEIEIMDKEHLVLSDEHLEYTWVDKNEIKTIATNDNYKRLLLNFLDKQKTI